MVLIRSYTQKRPDLKNFIVLILSILWDRFHVLRFLPIDIEITLAILFFLLTRKENFVPIWLVFIGGILNDFLSGGPIGETTLALLVFYSLFAQHKTFLESADLATQWVFFALCTCAFILVLWGLACLFSQSFLSLWPGIKAYGPTIFTYPLLYFILTRFSLGERFN